MTAGQQESSPGLPPELLNNDPHGFAWRVWRERTPRLVGQIKDAHPYGLAQRRALDGLLDEVAGRAPDWS